MTPASIQPQTYRFHLEASCPQGGRVRGVPLGESDFAPAVEAAFFDGLRRGRFPHYELPGAGIRLEPRFVEPNDGSPHCEGFTVILPTPTQGEHRVEWGLSWLRGRAERLMIDLLREGSVQEPVLLFHLAAYPEDDQPRRRPEGIILERSTPAVPIRERARRALGPAVAWDEPDEDDLPVLIVRQVLEEAVEQARGAPNQEVGGALLGHLCRDIDDHQLFLEVSCHVPARGTEADAASVTFTADTWDHARQIAQLRGEGEILVGWVHSHPFSLSEPCPEVVSAEQVHEVLFFSRDDRFVMEQAFARPFQVALQTAVDLRVERALGHLPVRLYSWRDGVAAPRGFQVIPGR